MLTERFSALEDPRTGRTKRHNLIDVVVIAICAAICGADSWVDVEMVGKSKKDWLSRLLDLPNGIRSHDIFGRVFTKPDSGQFERCFKERVDTVNEVMEGQVVAIDGKTVGGSHGGTAGEPAIRLVSAWASAKQLILGQVKVTDRSNEITVILDFSTPWKWPDARSRLARWVVRGR